MSLESEIAELRGTVTALTEIITRQVAIQERLAAGAEAAAARIDAGKDGTKAAPARRGRPAKSETTQTGSDEPADTESGADDAKTASEPVEEKKPEPKKETPKADAPKEVVFGDFAKAWLGTKDERGADEYKRRGSFLMKVLGNFGASKISELDAEHHKAAIFYLKRGETGKLEVNFEAEYDFDGDPAQDEPADEEFGSAFDD